MVKNRKILKNLKKSQQFTYNNNKKNTKKIKKKNAKKRKKCYPLSFPILGGHNSTRALQSRPFQKYRNLKKSLFFQKVLKCLKMFFFH